MSAASNIPLAPLSVFYGFVMSARRALYRSGIFATHRVSVPVISVGNITTGGTGKTPLVLWLAQRLAADGFRVCILTRGYGRIDSTKQVVVSDGQNLLADTAIGGDEARLLAEKLIGKAAVISNADRVSAAKWAIENFESNVLILDDGFQHLAIGRDLNIITIDSSNPWGGDRLLPRGRLREPIKEISRADAIVITRANVKSDIDQFRVSVEQLSMGRPVIISQTRTTGVIRLGCDEKIDDAQGDLEHPVLAFCAVGNPESFFLQAKRDGHKIIRGERFRDHHVYIQRDIDDLINKARACGAQSILTTAKDAVKLRGLRFDMPCYVLEIEMIFDDEKRLLELIDQAVHTTLTKQKDK